jgi:hypothetical protein
MVRKLLYYYPMSLTPLSPVRRLRAGPPTK